MKVRDLLEKIDKTHSGLDFIQIRHSDNSGSFNFDISEDKNVNMLEKYLDNNVKSLRLDTFDEYDEDIDGNSYVSYTSKFLIIEVQ